MRLTTLFWGFVAICVAAILFDYGLFAIATWLLCCQIAVIQAAIDYYFEKKKELGL